MYTMQGLISPKTVRVEILPKEKPQIMQLYSSNHLQF